MMKAAQERAEYRGEALAVRSILGGALMGLANLVPGISGGTMLLATGVYPQFITGVAEVSTFRFRGKSVLTLACVVGAAAAAILLLAGPVGRLVAEQRWIMYSMFIGLTLGGVPVLWSTIRRADSTVVMMSILGIAMMAVMAVFNPAAADGNGQGAYAILLLAGIAGGAAMIVPGLSGAYLLLVLGQYLTILGAIDQARQGASDGDWAVLADAIHVFIPVGIGVAVGVVGLSNLMKFLLTKYERPTLGLLLGLLLGAVIGLWPFVQPAADGLEEAVRGEMVRGGSEHFTPTLGQGLAALALAATGFLVSVGIAHLGRGRGRALGQ